MSKSEYMTIRLTEDTKEYLRRMAERDQRSVSNLLAVIIKQAIDKDKGRAIENL